MSKHHRNWRGYWNDVDPLASPHLDDAMKQVGKTQLGVPVGAEQIDMILQAIENALDLHEADHVVDLGCGNGLVSERIAVKVASVLGLDASPQLIEDAQRFRSTDTLKFAVGDFTDPQILSDWPGSLGVANIWKWYSYEVIQHLTHSELRSFLATVVAKVRNHEQGKSPGLRLFLGSIPDQAKIHAFYDTPQRWAHYERSLVEGVEQIGTWWEQDELRSLVEQAGFTFEVIPQERDLYTSHYRFHALLSLAEGDVLSHD